MTSSTPGTSPGDAPGGWLERARQVVADEPDRHADPRETDDDLSGCPHDRLKAVARVCDTNFRRGVEQERKQCGHCPQNVGNNQGREEEDCES